MTQYRKAQVTITATVFVPEQEIQDELHSDEDLLPTDAFMRLAKNKIDALFPTDDPLRILDVYIDIFTIR